MQNSNGSNGDFNSFYDGPSPSECLHWPLYYLDAEDDEEFRAGYPFSDIPEMELNESYEPDSTSTAVDNGVINSDDSGSDACLLTTKDNESITGLSSEQHEKVDSQLESSYMDEHCKNHEINSNELNNYNEEERDNDHQYDDLDQNNEMNVEKFEPSH